MGESVYARMWREAKKNNKEKAEKEEQNRIVINEAEVNQQEKRNAEQYKIVELPIDCLIQYPNQPFKPYTSEQLQPLIASIESHGIIEPLLVRKTENEKYEIISGHNRFNAAKHIGLEKVPANVLDLDDDQAAIAVAEANLRSRLKILPSERAFALKLEYDAMKHQGKRTDLLWDEFDHKLRTSEVMARNSEESEKQIRRYISLTRLNKELLDLLDNEKLPFTAAVSLSCINSDRQAVIYNFFYIDTQIGIDIKTAELLNECEENISKEFLIENFSKQTNGQKRLVNVKIKFKKIKVFFPNEVSEREIEETILKALEKYFEEEGKT